jgi:ribosomal protein S18 acetylase RimI-like enzyme
MKEDLISSPTPEQIKAFHKGLGLHNEASLKWDYEPFCIVITSSQNVVGGISGSSYWGRMHVDKLWVEPNSRKSGLGRKLVVAAEDLARNRRCRGIDLDTMSFQSAGFYEKLGFTLKGSIENFRDGHVRNYYSKEIQPGAGAPRSS